MTKINAAKRIRIVDAVKRLENAVREHAWKGSKHPQDHPAIEAELIEARINLFNLMEWDSNG